MAQGSERSATDDGDPGIRATDPGLTFQPGDILTGDDGEQYVLGDRLGVFGDGSPCDAPDPATVSMVDGHCRCIVCSRCGHHTGNANQGHYWAFCKVTQTIREHHFCCPGNCQLEAAL